MPVPVPVAVPVPVPVGVGLAAPERAAERAAGALLLRGVGSAVGQSDEPEGEVGPTPVAVPVGVG